MQRYKTKLVAKGFTQTYGIGYEEILAMSKDELNLSPTFGDNKFGLTVAPI